MAKIILGYPFSTYYAEETPVPEGCLLAVQAVVELLERKISASDFLKIQKLRKGAKEAECLQALVNSVDPAKFGKPLSDEEKNALREKITSVLQEIEFKEAGEIVSLAVAQIHNYHIIQPLFDDVELEEIIINGTKGPVLVYHREHGVCKTNLYFKTEKDLRALILQMITPSGKPFDDIRLPDGSRCNIAWPPIYQEPVLTIRKFRKQPLSLVDLINNGTLSLDLTAFLWVVIDGMLLFPLNVLVVGGTASGKTTMLNALSTFIPPNERIITIEEVRELNLYGSENWLALETTPNADLNVLLINALRMRPDRIIVGEVRGSEAENMFTAMNVGHRGSMGTLHANSARDVITRLESPPMNVPRALIPLIDLIMVQHRIYDRRKGLVRRIMQVSEVSRLEERIALNDIFEWNPQTDSLERTQLPSQALEKIAKGCNISIPDVMNEVKLRKAALEEIIHEGIHLQRDLNAFMARWYEERRKS